MRINAAASAVVAWAVATVADLESSYDHAVSEKSQPLPDVAVEIANVNTGISRDAFPDLLIDQKRFRTLTFAVVLVHEAKPENTASEWLANAADDLSEALQADPTLGGRVYRASRSHQWSFNPPYVVFDDNTKGRQATLTLSLAEEV